MKKTIKEWCSFFCRGEIGYARLRFKSLKLSDPKRNGLCKCADVNRMCDINKSECYKIELDFNDFALSIQEREKVLFYILKEGIICYLLQKEERREYPCSCKYAIDNRCTSYKCVFAKTDLSKAIKDLPDSKKNEIIYRMIRYSNPPIWNYDQLPNTFNVKEDD
jgi:hypothetical protein